MVFAGDAGLTYFCLLYIMRTADRVISATKILSAHRWRLINDRLENIVRIPDASNKCLARRSAALSEKAGLLF